MDYQMLVLDIDGTLTNSEKKISPATQEALLQLQQDGIYVVLASGRPTAGVLPYARELRLQEFGNYILSYNGARILNLKTNEIIYDKALPVNVIPLLYEEAVSSRIGLISYEKDGIIAATPIDPYMEYEARINGLPIREISDFPSYVTFPVNKCLMTGEPKHLEAVGKRLQKHFHGLLNIYRSEPYFLEIMPQGIDKAASLQKLLGSLGLTQNQMVCCGDGYNDVSMIEFAGVGVAMANAQEIVKDAADFVTDSNNEDGIVRVIEKFFLKQSASL